MHGSNATPAHAYRNASLDAAVAAASPHQLIVMLFQGTRAAIAQARHAVARGDAVARGRAISKASAIIDDGLRASLDVERGGALAEGLDALYEYAAMRLALANADGDVRKLEEVDGLLGGLEESWRQIGAAPAGAPAPAAPAPERRAPLSYGKV